MGKQWKQWQMLFSWAPKSLQMVTAAMKLKDSCSLEKKAMTNLDSILKSRDITLLTNVHLVKAMVFPVIMYGCEIWTIKLSSKELMLLSCGAEKTLESPLDSKTIQPGNPKRYQSVLNIHWKDWCWSWNSNTLATSCQELIHWRRSWCWERLKARGEGDDRGRDGWMASPTQWAWVWVNPRSWWWTGRPGMLQSMGSQRVGHHWATELTDCLAKPNSVVFFSPLPNVLLSNLPPSVQESSSQSSIYSWWHGPH